MEIEKKFLLPLDAEVDISLPSMDIEQYYITSIGKSQEIRLRKVVDNETNLEWFEFTEKIGHGAKRRETTESLSRDVYATFRAFRKGGYIRKTRYKDGDLEIDVYKGDLSPLKVAEVEFETEEQFNSFEQVHPLLTNAIDVTNTVAFKNRILADTTSYEDAVKRMSRDTENTAYRIHESNSNC